MEKITLPGKIWTLVSVFIFSTIVFSTASTSDLAELTITVDDVQNVSCPGDTTGAISVNVSGGTGIYTYSWTHTDDGTTYAVNEPNITGLGAGSYSVTVTDESGLTETSEPIEITISDIEAPVITVTPITQSADLDECTAAITSTTLQDSISVSDNCSVGAPTGSRSDGLALSDSYPVGTTIITWNVTDANGNPADPVDQTITVTDDQAPVATAVTTITISLNASGQATLLPEDVDDGSLDNCPSSLQLSLSRSTFDCSHLGTNTIQLIASDNTNPDSEVDVEVIVIDDLAPVITAEPVNVSTDPGQCYATVAMTASAEDNDTCGSVDLQGVRSDGLPLTDTYPVGPTTITWTARDSSNNEISVEQVITVTDTEKPVIDFAPSITKDNSPRECYASVAIYPPKATDNCGVGEPVGTRNDGRPLSATYPVGTTVISWDVTDIHGVAAETVKQVITIVDAEKPLAPTLPDIETSCEITLTPPKGTDNCTVSENIKVTTSDPLTYKPQNNITEHTITWRFEDEKGNVTYADQKLTINPIITTLTTSEVTCNGGNDGTIEIEAVGGEPPYTFALNNDSFSNTSVFTNLTAGIYNVKVKDQTGCIWQESVEIVEPDALAYTPPADGIYTTTTAESCYGAQDGSIQLNGTITGGNGNYQYSVDNINFSSNPITGLNSGEYEVFVQDTNGCRLPQAIPAVVEGPDELKADIEVIDVKCYQADSGGIKVSNPTGGNSTPYSFRINGGNWQTNSTPTGYDFSGLTAGIYTVDMKDASDCIRTLATVTITEPDILLANVTTTRTTTYGSATGSATASPTGGNGLYTYQWKNSNGVLVATSQTVTGLKAGTYEVTVSDSAGCKDVRTFQIFDAVKAEISAISVCMETEDTIRTSTFQVDVDQTMGGEGESYAFTYSWDFGEGASLPSGTTGIGPFEVSYLSPGDKTITLTVTDEGGVTSVHTYQHYVGECFETCDSSQNFEAYNDSFYIGDANGVKMGADECDDSTPMYIWFIVKKSSNVYRLYSEFIYTVSTASSTKQYKATNCFANLDSNGVPIQLKPEDKVRLNEIGPGENQINWKCDEVLNLIHITYKWTNNTSKACGDTERNMCASSNETIPVATPIRAYAETTNTCYGVDEGSIILYAFGGTGEFDFQAVNTVTNDTITSTINVFNDLPAGNYTVTVTDKKDVAEELGQEKNSYVIYDVIIEEPEEALVATVDSGNVSCYGNQDGWAEVTSVTGGVPGYTYLWNDPGLQKTPRAKDLGPGTYTVTITDTWGCTTMETITITQPPALTKANAGPDQTKCGFTSTNLEANTALPGNGRWEIIYQPTGTLPVITDPTDPNSEFTATEGKYELSWTISNADGSCFSTDNVTINIIENCNFLDFDGLDDYVDMGTESYNFNTGAFSIEAWVKLKTTAGTRSILSKKDLSGAAGAGYELVITSGGVPTFKTGSVSIFPNSSVPLNTQRWYHIAVSYDGTTAKLYVDGIQVNSLTTSNPSPSSAPFIVGATYDSASLRLTKPTTHFNGWIEEVRLWNTALTAEQLRFMMNQRLEKNTAADGTVMIKGTELPMDVPGSLQWSDLAGYYQLLALEAADGNGTTVDLSDTPVPGVLKNITTFQENTAPLPYVSKRDGNWRDIEASTTPWLYGRGKWDAPNSLGINQQPIDWNIVRTSHNLISGNKNITVLGLLSEERLATDGTLASSLSVFDPNHPLDEYNPGHALRVTHYLKLNGFLNLVGESQLLQNEGSILEESSTGFLERDQQGTASSFNYNYWSSPVSPRGSANNSPYTIEGVLRDGTDPANPGALNFNYQYHWADGSYTGAKRISTYWLYTYTNFTSNTYSEWHYVGKDGEIKAGEGYTMKGTSGSAAIKDRQNYTFTGKPNNGTITHVVSPGNDYLVGNPYPSAIDSWEFIRDNIKDGGNRTENVFNGTLYFWDHFSGRTHYLKRYIGGYATLNLAGGIEAIATDERINATGEHADKALNPRRYIPVGQAFYVSTQVDQALSGIAEVSGGEIMFKNSQRAFETEHQVDDESIFKSKEEKQAQKQQSDQRSKIYLRYSSPEGFHRQILVTQDENTTSGFDLGYDAPLIENIDEDMYWLIHDVGFVIQGVPDFGNERELPLTVKLHKEGEFTIAIDKLENIPADFQIHLKDTLTKTTHDLRKSAFKMTEVAGSIEGRFRLVFPNVVDPEETPSLEKTSLTSYYSSKESKVSIENPYLIPILGATMYNINGQKLEEYNDIPLEKLIELPVERRASGVYILKLQMENESKSIKFIVE
ncbi:Por secretion system C-terminal sorting domain-containing protein [Salinimicrobium catena]|uniref:Por secretion system C-terminal sorting domain-containing protein n=1 Tax=Salinimicrobium catena TaxID=390640 RepID=A0A1H5NYN6_9FLAO|nr:LamG-like jellyroll fold domain-containing protein [Salinimicrobium catena]SDL65273.1 Por secretion system C-terminal sorting domain-containing protein [Salinimicrobium catena]SEF06540.1 Por secretion system C-terminal sorting domain-containing protein [Salinimicrobium catena]